MEPAFERWPSADRRRTARGHRCPCLRLPQTSASRVVTAMLPAMWTPRGRRPWSRAGARARDVASSAPFRGIRLVAGHLPRVRDIGTQLPDEAFRRIRCVAARAERVTPLAIAERGQERARPLGVVERDAVTDQFRMLSVVAERQVAVSHPRDEFLAFEEIQIVPPWPEA